MWIPKDAVSITGRRLFEARCLLEEIRNQPNWWLWINLLLTCFWYEGLIANNRLLHSNTNAVVLTNAVRVLLHVTLCKKHVKFSVLHQFSFWRLGTSLCITLAFCYFLSISNFISGTGFSITFYFMAIDNFSGRGKLEILKPFPFFKIHNFFRFFNNESV